MKKSALKYISIMGILFQLGLDIVFFIKLFTYSAEIHIDNIIMCFVGNLSLCWLLAFILWLILHKHTIINKHGEEILLKYVIQHLFTNILTLFMKMYTGLTLIIKLSLTAIIAFKGHSAGVVPLVVVIVIISTIAVILSFSLSRIGFLDIKKKSK